MGILDNFKEAMKMRSEGKRIQNEINKITATHTNGGITVVVKGDMTVASITVDPSAYDEVKAGKPARFETMLLNVVNAALKKARDAMQQEMAKLMQSSELGSLFGR